MTIQEEIKWIEKEIERCTKKGHPYLEISEDLLHNYEEIKKVFFVIEYEWICYIFKKGYKIPKEYDIPLEIIEKIKDEIYEITEDYYKYPLEKRLFYFGYDMKNKYEPLLYYKLDKYLKGVKGYVEVDYDFVPFKEDKMNTILVSQFVFKVRV